VLFLIKHLGSPRQDFISQLPSSYREEIHAFSEGLGFKRRNFSFFPQAGVLGCIAAPTVLLQSSQQEIGHKKSDPLTDSKDSFRLSLFSLTNNDLEKSSEGDL
jgi:hypothetical protein